MNCNRRFTLQNMRAELKIARKYARLCRRTNSHTDLDCWRRIVDYWDREIAVRKAERIKSK